MKTFIIHTDHEKSKECAQEAMVSFEHYIGWEPEFFLGMTYTTLSNWEQKFPLQIKSNSRAEDFFAESKLGITQLRHYQAKKCCALNQYRLLRKCVELNETIVLIEHDSICIGDWVLTPFDDVLVLNAESAMTQKVYSHIQKNQPALVAGVQDINFNGLKYGDSKGRRGKDKELKHAHIMPGLAAYAISPTGAKKMVNVFESKGWEQGDMIINTGHVRIQTRVPELFTFNKRPNLSMSHGKT